MRLLRVAGITLAVGLLLSALLHGISMLILPAPFRQPYWQAASDENRLVTLQLLWILVGLPGSLGLLVLALPGKMAPWRRLLRFGGISLIATALLAGAVFLFLPYGFGSGYAHASPEQITHLSICGRCAWLFAPAGVLMLVASAVARTKAGSES